MWNLRNRFGVNLYKTGDFHGGEYLCCDRFDCESVM